MLDERGSRRAEMLELVNALYVAARGRDTVTANALLARPYASRLPRDVREEVLALLREPADSLRAPMRLLRYGYVLTQLGSPDDLEHDRSRMDQLRLELEEVDDPRTWEAPRSGAVRATRPHAASLPIEREEGTDEDDARGRGRG
jgi:hypothetical protein